MYKLRQWRQVVKLYFPKYIAEADPGFQVRGGGGALKKIAPSRGRHENFRGISCKKSLFYAKKSYFFQFLCISCEKSRFYAKKSYFFRWAHTRCPPPPCIDKVVIIEIKQTCHTVWLHYEDISICFYLF